MLAAGGSALDAVCAAVEQLEDDPLFNAGRGAALTAAGTAELDACVMTGDGRAGAITACRHARNPVLAARKVMEETPGGAARRPDRGAAAPTGSWPPSPPEYFLTPARQQQLRNVQARALEASRHGTVGAVALDVAGPARGGDVHRRHGQPERGPGRRHPDRRGRHLRPGRRRARSPAPVRARPSSRASSPHDVAARVRYLGMPLADAIAATVERGARPRTAPWAG